MCYSKRIIIFWCWKKTGWPIEKLAEYWNEPVEEIKKIIGEQKWSTKKNI